MSRTVEDCFNSAEAAAAGPEFVTGAVRYGRTKTAHHVIGYL
jgi:hypothetical protein